MSSRKQQKYNNKNIKTITFSEKPDSSGVASLIINVENQEKVRVMIPFCLKVVDIFRIFDEDQTIDWCTHSLKIGDTLLWYDNPISDYKNIIRRDTEVTIVPDEEDSLFTTGFYYFCTWLSSLWTKCLRPKPEKKEPTRKRRRK